MEPLPDLVFLIKDSLNQESPTMAQSCQQIAKLLQNFQIISDLFQILSKNVEYSLLVCFSRCIKTWIINHNQKFDDNFFQFLYSQLESLLHIYNSKEITNLFLFTMTQYDHNHFYIKFIINFIQNLLNVSEIILEDVLQLIYFAFSDNITLYSEDDYFTLFCSSTMQIITSLLSAECNELHFNILYMIFKNINIGIKFNYQFDSAFVENINSILFNLINSYYQNIILFQLSWRLISYAFKLSARFLKAYDLNITKSQFIELLLSLIPQTQEIGITHITESLVFAIKCFSNYIPINENALDMIILSAQLNQMTIDIFNEAPLSFYTNVYSMSGFLSSSYKLAIKICETNNEMFSYLLSLEQTEITVRIIAILSPIGKKLDNEIMKDFCNNALQSASSPIEMATSVFLFMNYVECFSHEELLEKSNEILSTLFSMRDYDVLLCMGCKLCCVLSAHNVPPPDELVLILVQLSNTEISKFATKALSNIAQYHSKYIVPVASEILNLFFNLLIQETNLYLENDESDDIIDIIKQRTISIIELLNVSQLPVNDERILHILVNLQSCCLHKKLVRLSSVVISNRSPISPQIVNFLYECLKNDENACDYLQNYLLCISQLIFIDPEAFASCINFDEFLGFCIFNFENAYKFDDYCAAMQCISWSVIQGCCAQNIQIIIDSAVRSLELPNHQFLADILLISIFISGINIINQELIERIKEYLINNYIIRVQDIVMILAVFEKLHDNEMIELTKSKLEMIRNLTQPEKDLITDNMPLCFQITTESKEFPLMNII